MESGRRRQHIIQDGLEAGCLGNWDEQHNVHQNQLSTREEMFFFHLCCFPNTNFVTLVESD